MTPYYAELSADGVPTVRFEGSQTLQCLGISKNGIEGWDSTPAAKVTVTERGQGDGGHDIMADDILYASRTVSLHFNTVDLDRERLSEQLDALRRMVHRPVRLRVVDIADTYCDGGYLSLNIDAKRHESWTEECTATIVFERPERLSTQAMQGDCHAGGTSGGGLYYGDTYKGLTYPVDYGASNAGADLYQIRNNGTSRAYPVYTLQGDWPDGVHLTLTGSNGTSSELWYDAPIHMGTPVTLDTRSSTATLGGVDVSRNLSRRGFQTVPPLGYVSVLLDTPGSGWVTVTSHDTYM